MVSILGFEDALELDKDGSVVAESDEKCVNIALKWFWLNKFTNSSLLFDVASSILCCWALESGATGIHRKSSGKANPLGKSDERSNLSASSDHMTPLAN